MSKYLHYTNDDAADDDKAIAIPRALSENSRAKNHTLIDSVCA